jgi:hypothetical protein
MRDCNGDCNTLHNRSVLQFHEIFQVPVNLTISFTGMTFANTR